MIENFIKHIKNKDEHFIIFDIGSRDCIQSIEFYNSFPNSKIYAFECNPNTLNICKKNIENYSDRITLIEGAVCDYDGNIRFYPINQEKTITTWKDGNPGASSIFKSNGNYTVETYVQDEIITNCHRLDSVMNKYDISRVDIIWMDLQGSELLALKGLGNYLHNVIYIYTEACHIPIYTNQALFEDINEYLVNFYSFKLLTEINSNSQFEDVIYENKFHKDPIFDKINLTYNEQTFIRGKPIEYILHTINLFKKYTNQKIILEIGSIRSKMMHDINKFNPYCCNDGHSTYFWKKYTDAEIYTVDIDINCKNIIDSDERLSGVKSFTDDAIFFANNFHKKIDLLYLDAWDIIDGTPYAEKHLEIYNILKDKLSKNCLLLIDDTDICSGGKGKLLIPLLIQSGFKCIFNKRQSLFIRFDKYQDIKHIDIDINNLSIINNLSVEVSKEDIIYKNTTYDLTKFKRDKYSQRGHDGIIQEITTQLNIQSGFFIEFGAWDGIHLSNCRNLYENGWKGCFIEPDTEKYIKLIENYKDTGIICLNKFVYPTIIEGDTIDNLYKEYMNNIEIDLLSMDIDGREYEIFENMDLKPKLIVIEGGFLFHPCLRTKIPYDEAKNNIQQPLFVLFELAKKKGYTPICFNQDTFLLRTDLYETYHYFKNIKNDYYTLWKSAFYNIFNEIDRQWLIDYRKNNSIVNKYEHIDYLNLIHSINNVFDIVIPVGPNDKDIIYKQIEYTKKNIIGYRNIYLICYDSNIIIDGCITINENIFPFSLETVSNIHGKVNRNGWYLQQLLKIYALITIPEILERCLVIDADTFFLKPTVFIKNNKCLYNYGYEYHKPYFEHMLRLDNDLIKVNNKSGICHHMMFEKIYINELINKIEKKHNDTFYNVFLKMVTEHTTSGSSEYEIYFNYILKNHNDKIEIRKLEWININHLYFDALLDFDYISYHWHFRS